MENNLPSNSSGIDQLRNKLIDVTLVVTGVIAVLVLLLVFSQSLKNGFTKPIEAIIGVTTSTLLILGAMFRKKINLKYKVFIFAITTLTYASINLINYGFIANAKVFLVAMPIYFAFYFSLRNSLLFASLTLVIYLFVGYLFSEGILSYSFDMDTYLSHWSIWPLSSLMMLVSSIGILFGGNYFIKETIRSYERVLNQEVQYRTLFEASGDGVLILKDNKIIDCNSRALGILKGTRDDVVGLSPWQISPDYQPDGQLSEEKAKATLEECWRNSVVEFEWQHKTFNNELIDIEITLSKSPKEDEVFFVTWRDITQKKALQNKLLENEQSFKMMVDGSPFAIILSKENEEKVSYYNKTFVDIFGYTKDEVPDVGKWWGLAYPDVDYRNKIKDLWKKNVMDAIENKTSFENIETTVKCKNGQMKIIDWGFITMGERHIVFGMDITERKNYEKNLAESKQKADQEIFKTMVQSEERERARYAKELHDGLGPLLSTSKIYLSTIKKKEQDDQLIEYIDRTQQMINETIESIRQISNNLSPDILINYGLVQGIRSFIEKLNLVSEVKFELKANIETRLSQTIEFTLYRTLTELINNTLKYAQATRINITFEETEDLFTITYTDNGKGFDYEEAKTRNTGFGLVNLENRIKKVGGNYHLTSETNKGVEVKVSFKR